MRGPLAAFFAAVSIAGCSAFVSLDGLLVPDGGMPSEAGLAATTNAPDARDCGLPDRHVQACPSNKGAMVDVDGRCVDALDTSYHDYIAFTGANDGGLAMMPPSFAP